MEHALRGDGELSTPGTAVEVYSPIADTWSTMANLPTPRSDLGAALGSDGRNYTVGGDNGAVSGAVEALTVPAEVEFAASAFQVAQGASRTTITVLRTGNVTGTASVQYAVSPGSATPGVDYTPVAGTLSFASGQTSQQFSIPLLGNGGNGRPNKTILLTLSNPSSGVTLSNPPTAVLVLVGSGSFRSPPPGTSPPSGGGTGSSSGGGSTSPPQQLTLAAALAEGMQALVSGLAVDQGLPQLLASAGNQSTTLFSAAFGLFGDEFTLFADVIVALQGQLFLTSPAQLTALASNISSVVADMYANSLFSRGANFV